MSRIMLTLWVRRAAHDVSQAYYVAEEDLFRPGKSYVSSARMILCWLIVEMTGCSHNSLALILGIDPTTVNYGVNQVTSRLYRRDPSMRLLLLRLFAVAAETKYFDVYNEERCPNSDKQAPM